MKILSQNEGTAEFWFFLAKAFDLCTDVTDLEKTRNFEYYAESPRNKEVKKWKSETNETSIRHVSTMIVVLSCPVLSLATSSKNADKF